MTNYEILQMKLVNIQELENACNEGKLGFVLAFYTDFQLEYVEGLLVKNDLVGIRINILETVKNEIKTREENDAKFLESAKNRASEKNDLSFSPEFFVEFIKMDRNLKLRILDKAVELNCIEEILNEFSDEQLDFIESCIVRDDIVGPRLIILTNVKAIQSERTISNTPMFKKRTKMKKY